MKIGFTLVAKEDERAKNIYNLLKKNGFNPDFIIYCYPRNIFLYYLTRLKNRKSLRFKNFLKNPPRIYKVRDINSLKAFKIFVKEKADITVVLGCGILGKRLCQTFPNTFINAHAGKLPEYRGMNSVEWTYLEDKPLIGTIHFISSNVDSGDIIYEENLPKLKSATDIEKIRQAAFDEVFALIPKALKKISSKNYLSKRQPSGQTTRYRMHLFLKKVLTEKLKNQ